jgi:hypothetical protein
MHCDAAGGNPARANMRKRPEFPILCDRNYTNEKPISDNHLVGEKVLMQTPICQLTFAMFSVVATIMAFA